MKSLRTKQLVHMYTKVHKSLITHILVGESSIQKGFQPSGRNVTGLSEMLTRVALQKRTKKYQDQAFGNHGKCETNYIKFAGNIMREEKTLQIFSTYSFEDIRKLKELIPKCI